MRQCKPINEILKFPRARTRFTPAFVAVVVLSVIASHAHAQMAPAPVVPLTGSTPLVVTVTPTGTTFMRGDTVNIIATRGEGASVSTELTLIGDEVGFALRRAELRIEAVAPDGRTTTAIQDGIEIGFPDVAYDSIAGDKAGGFLIDGFRVAVDDIGSVAGRVYAERPTDTANSHGFTAYSPGVSSDLANSLGSTHIIRLGDTGVVDGEFEEVPTLDELLRLISAQKIRIKPGYTGGSFKLRVILIEFDELDKFEFDDIRNSVTVETLIPLIPFPSIRLRIRTFLEGALQ